MTPADRIDLNHRPGSGSPGADRACAWDREPWPCDAERLLDDWRALRRALVQVTDLLDNRARLAPEDREYLAGRDAIAAARELLAREVVVQDAIPQSRTPDTADLDWRDQR